MRTEVSLAIYVELDRDSPVSMAAQLAAQLGDAIAGGRLAEGERLPSTRTLADLLGVSRPVVQDAYRLLEERDRIEVRRGSGAYVKGGGRPSPMRATADRAGAPGPDAAPLADLSPDQPSGDDFPVAVWRAAWRRASHRIPESCPPQGDLLLRQAVADHLRTTRGLDVSAGEVLVTTGVRQSLDMVATVAMPPGSSVAVEDPCLPTVIRLFHQRGIATLPLPVDDEGAVVGAAQAEARVVMVRPSHQMPLGVTLSLRRRQELAALAVDRGLLVIEDDRDHDFTETVRPSSLWDLTRDHTDDVVYVGCLCRLLPDVVCTGYVLARGARYAQLAELLSLRQSGTVPVAQRAVAELLRSTEMRGRISRLRQAWGAKRRLVADALAGHPAVVRLSGTQSGSHVFAELDPRLRDAEVARAVRRAGIVVPAAGGYHWSGAVPPANGLVISHGHVDEATLARCLRTIAQVLGQVSRVSPRTRLAPPALTPPTPVRPAMTIRDDLPTRQRGRRRASTIDP